MTSQKAPNLISSQRLCISRNRPKAPNLDLTVLFINHSQGMSSVVVLLLQSPEMLNELIIFHHGSWGTPGSSPCALRSHRHQLIAHNLVSCVFLWNLILFNLDCWCSQHSFSRLKEAHLTHVFQARGNLLVLRSKIASIEHKNAAWHRYLFTI